MSLVAVWKCSNRLRRARNRTLGIVNVVTNQDLAFVEVLAPRGVAVTAVIVGALLDRLRAGPALGGSDSEITWLEQSSIESTAQ
jgi:hypothetical protein